MGDIEWKAPGFPGFGAVFIGRQVQRLGRGVGLLVREAVKSDASEATLPLPPVVLAALERRRKEQTTEMLRAPKPREDGAIDERFHWRGGDVRPGKRGFIFTSESVKTDLRRESVLTESKPHLDAQGTGFFVKLRTHHS